MHVWRFKGLPGWNSFQAKAGYDHQRATEVQPYKCLPFHFPGTVIQRGSQGWEWGKGGSGSSGRGVPGVDVERGHLWEKRNSCGDFGGQ